MNEGTTLRQNVDDVQHTNTHSATFIYGFADGQHLPLDIKLIKNVLRLVELRAPTRKPTSSIRDVHLVYFIIIFVSSSSSILSIHCCRSALNGSRRKREKNIIIDFSSRGQRRCVHVKLVKETTATAKKKWWREDKKHGKCLLLGKSA